MRGVEPVQRAVIAPPAVVWRVVGETSGVMAGVGGFVVIKGISPAYDLLPMSGSSVPGDTPPTLSWSAEHSGKYQVKVSDPPTFTVLRMTSRHPDTHWLTDTQWTPDPSKWKRVADSEPRDASLSMAPGHAPDVRALGAFSQRFTLAQGQARSVFEDRWEYSNKNTRFQIDRPERLGA